MGDGCTIKLAHPIEIFGEPVRELRIRRAPGDLRMGDLKAIQQWAYKAGMPCGAEDVARLLSDGFFGAILVLVERLCGLPEGAADQIHPDDFGAVVEALTPFFAPSQEDGK